MPDIRILFVEDQKILIEELVDTLKANHPEWMFDFAFDIPEAWEQLTTNDYALVVADIMLPAWNDLPERSEGIFLAKWLMAARNAGPVAGNGGNCSPPKGRPRKTYRSSEIIFLTSREVSGVESEIEEALGGCVSVYNRLQQDEFLAHIERTLTGEADAPREG